MTHPQPTTVVLVTGGGTGIGAATAAALRDAGHSVAICGRRSEPLERVSKACGALPIVADISTEDGAISAVERTTAELGGLGGLVLNAGIIHPGGIADLTLEQWNEMLRVNLTGSWLVAKAALPALVTSRGAVVSVASEAALRASDGMAGYSAGKAGLTLLTQSLGVEYGSKGVRANVVCPGWTATEMGDYEMTELGVEKGISRDEAYGLVTSIVPLRRPATSGEVAGVISWLLSPASSYINAAVIPVDGGACAVDPATVPFDPRVTVYPYDQGGSGNHSSAR